LTNEQIEAEYFPGIVPIDPSDPEIRWDDLVVCPDGNHWLVRALGGLEVLVAGTTDAPDAGHLTTAKLAVSQIDKVRSLSVQLLQSFVHEPGSWSLNEINVGEEALRNRCDFQTALSFSPNDGSDSYGYTSFVVCFRLTQGSHTHRVHPFKTVIEFL